MITTQIDSYILQEALTLSLSAGGHACVVVVGVHSPWMMLCEKWWSTCPDMSVRTLYQAMFVNAIMDATMTHLTFTSVDLGANWTRGPMRPIGPMGPRREGGATADGGRLGSAWVALHRCRDDSSHLRICDRGQY